MAPATGADMPGSRPGDWVCPWCSNVNFASRDACNRCGVPRSASDVPTGFEGSANGSYGKVAAVTEAMRSSPYSMSTDVGGGKGTGKNEIRPGDWWCPSCGNHNYASKIACNRCGAPKPMYDIDGNMDESAQAAFDAAAGLVGLMASGGGEEMDPGVIASQAMMASALQQFGTLAPTAVMPSFLEPVPPPPAMPSAYSPPQAPMGGGRITSGGGGGKGGGPGSRPGDWTCQACGNINFASRDVCNRCHIPKAMVVAAAPPPPVMGVRAGDWLCPSCGNHNYSSKTHCSKCHTARTIDSVSKDGMRPGDWICSGCNNHNYANKSICNKCHMPKQAAAFTMP